MRSIHPSGAFAQRGRGGHFKSIHPSGAFAQRGRGGHFKSIHPSGAFAQRGRGGSFQKYTSQWWFLYRLVLSSMQCVCVSPARILAHIIMSLFTGTVADKLVSAL